MQFSHIWAETGEHKKLLGRPCWRNQIYRVTVWKLRTENKGEARGLAEMEQAASPSLSSGKQETEAGKKAQQGDTKPLDSRKKPFQTPKRKALPLEKGNMAVQAGNGEGTCFYRTHYVASGLRVPRTAFPTVAVPLGLLPHREVIQSSCQFLQIRRGACMGIWIVGQGA